MDCFQYLPHELLRIICEYHHCIKCYNNNLYHCYNCRECNVDRKSHLFCNVCDKCFPKYVKIYMNSTNYAKLNYHEHCNNCNGLMKANLREHLYICTNCHDEK
jgi:hypothetical protein